MLGLAGCSLSVAYEDTRYQCDPSAPACPTDFVCRADGVCVPPGELTETASPGPAPDAAAEATDPAAEDVRLVFGERPTADFRDVTTDTFIDSSLPTDAFGAEVTVRSDGEPARYGLLRFDLGVVPAGRTIVSAKLRLYFSDRLPSGNIELQPVLESWDEDRATYEERASGTEWATPGGQVGPVVAKLTPDVEGEYVVSLPTALVQAWLATPASNQGLRTSSTSPDGSDGQFRSSESDVPAERPQLELVLKPR